MCLHALFTDVHSLISCCFFYYPSSKELRVVYMKGKKSDFLHKLAFSNVCPYVHSWAGVTNVCDTERGKFLKYASEGNMK